MRLQLRLALLALVLTSCTTPTDEQPAQLRALIIDGASNHYVWPKTSFMMKDYLEQTGLFEVDMYRSDSVWYGDKYNPDRPVPIEGYLKQFPLESSAQQASYEPFREMDLEVDFSQYDVIIPNVGWKTPSWPPQVKQAFEAYMNNGGGLVLIHAANNAFPDWPAWNQMAGVGGWGGRDGSTGPFVYLDEDDQVVRDTTGNTCGAHGPEREYVVTTRAPEHPIMRGLPQEWLHAQDELYEFLRGPFENATILATGKSDTTLWADGSHQHVPLIMTIEYGEGRVFHTPMGHFDYSWECLGLKTVFQRGAEWAATGDVSLEVPEGFVGGDRMSSVRWTGLNNAKE